jgi:EPS-associated MarR family transcriptional regulator
MPHPVSEEVRYRLLRHLEQHADASQRELAAHLGVSIGKVNYCLRALISKGLVKMRNFRNSRNKVAYAYVLTPKGIEEKINVTASFLKRKIAEYDSIAAEIERLTSELKKDSGNSGPDNAFVS